MPLQARIFLSTCTSAPFESRELLRLLRIELESSGTKLDGVTSGTVNISTTNVDHALIIVDVLNCEPGATEVLIRAEHSHTGKKVHQSFDLKSIEALGRNRALVLAIVELVRASWVNLSTETPIVRETPMKSVTPSSISTQQIEHLFQEWKRQNASQIEVHSKVQLYGSIGALFYPATNAGLMRLSLGSTIALMKRIPLHAALDLNGGFGSSSDPLGDLSINEITVGLSLFIVGHHPIVRAALGPKVEAGLGWITGTPYRSTTKGETLRGALVTLWLRSLVQVHLAANWSALLDIGAGYVVKGLDAKANERRAVRLNGITFCVSIGPALHF